MTLSPKHQQALDAILDRASVDIRFRHELLHDPRAAIQDSFGVLVPEHFNIRFVERDPGVDAMVVLPDFRACDGELSDDDLRCVSGGTGDPPIW